MPLDVTALPTITRERDNQDAVLVISCKGCHQVTVTALLRKSLAANERFASTVLTHAVERGDHIRVLYSSEPIALNGCECKEKS